MEGKTVIDEVDGSIDGDKTRQRSTIEFPYHDLDNAIKVANAIHSNAGTKCSVNQLAAYLKQSSSSGAFRMRLSAARIFSLVETEKRGGDINLTTLGLQILDPKLSDQARAKAFLTVQLYSAIYEKYKSKMLPPAKALEKEIEAFGVAPKQKSAARQAFERSARQAGFFAHGEDRLVEPASRNDLPQQQQAGSEQPEKMAPSRSKSGDSVGTELHPFIQGLVQELPAPNSNWPLNERVRWLQAATNIFPLIYSDDNDSGQKKINVSQEGRVSLGGSDSAD